MGVLISKIDKFINKEADVPTIKTRAASELCRREGERYKDAIQKRLTPQDKGVHLDLSESHVSTSFKFLSPDKRERNSGPLYCRNCVGPAIAQLLENSKVDKPISSFNTEPFTKHIFDKCTVMPSVTAIPSEELEALISMMENLIIVRGIEALHRQDQDVQAAHAKITNLYIDYEALKRKEIHDARQQ
ncbi:hypothetical protein HAX54_008153 [Datura stramonium]|uniref:Uncharacterized protein n=1 Tax=Datura stramonium TaxID=4076 RepID=A0ABS8RYQ1_DATST|nr:hypothetical protein [Datura stramonium]